MSDSLKSIIAVGGNSSASKSLRARKQPRDKKGRWVTTGAAMFASVSLSNGKILKVKGRAVGGTATKKGEKNDIRMLVDKGYGASGIPENTVLEVDSKNGELESKIQINRDFLKKKGIDPDLQHDLPKSIADMPQKLENMNAQPGDELDIELATNGLTDEEDKEFRAERDKEPLAKLPPALAEQAVEGEDVNKLLDEAGKADSPFIDLIPKSALEVIKLRDAGLIDSTGGIQPGARFVPGTRMYGGTWDTNDYWYNPDGSVVRIRNEKVGSKSTLPTGVIDPDMLRDMWTPADVKNRNPAKVADNAIANIMAEVSLHGDTEVKFEALDELFSEKSSLKPTAPMNLNVGDVVRSKAGKDSVIVDLKLDPSSGGRSFMKLQNEDGTVAEVPIDLTRKLNVVQGRKATIAQPTEPTEPTAKAKPAKPAKPAPKPVDKTTELPTTKEEPPLLPPTSTTEGPPEDKIDDGGDIVHSPLTDEERTEAVRKKIPAFITKMGRILEYFDNNGKRKQASDPFELLNSLAEAYPNAKFTPEGDALILDRRIDSDGRVFELKASNTGSKALVYSMNWTDPETGEVETLIHYDKRHSITSVFRKDNSSDGLMAKLLSVEPLKQGNASPIPGFGEASLRERAEWYKMKQKMFTPEGLATFYGNGRPKIFHKDKGTFKHRDVLSIWEAYPEYKDNSDDPELKDAIYHGLLGVFGRLPIDSRAHRAARKQLRLEFKNRFPEESARKMGGLITNASRMSMGKTYDLDAETKANPYASKNRVTPIEPGQVVEYKNNKEELLNLVVIGYAPNVNVSPGNEGYDYNDFIYLKDADGKTVRLNAIQLRILKDQDTPLSKYSPNIDGKELRDHRANLGFYGDSSTDSPNDPTGVDTFAAEPDAPLPDVVDDLEPGDMLPNLNGEGTLGEIVSSRFVRGEDGEESIAFTVATSGGGTEIIVYALGEEIPKKD
jgi:hypothetical protein